MMADTADTDVSPTAPKDAVASIAGQIAKLSTGDRAVLRRLYLVEGSHSRAFAGDGVVLGLLHRAGVSVPMVEGVSGPTARERTRDSAYDAWRLVAHVAAVLSGTGGRQAHSPGGRLGAALFDAGVSASRMMRLFSAKGTALHDQVRLLARRLAQSGEPTNLWSIYHLVAADPIAAENARIRIAQEYQAAVARSEGDSK